MSLSEAPGFDVLELLFQSSADCIKLLDLDGRLLCMNLGGATAMDLLHPAQFVGEDWVDFWIPSERIAARAAIDIAKAGGVGRSHGYLATLKGTPKWWDSVVSPLRGANGAVDRLLVVSRDVSERRRADETKAQLTEDLQTAVRRTEALILATSEIVWQADAQRRAVTEHGWTAFTGRALSDDGRSMWLATIHPDDRDRMHASSRAAWAAGIEEHSEYRLRHHSGEYRWVHDHMVPLRGQNGEVREWVGVVRDIHSQVVADQSIRDGEERLRLAVAASRVGIWDVDLVTGERSWSAEHKAILGLPEDALESEALFFEHVHPEDRQAVREAHRQPFERVGFPALTFRITRSDTGEERWILSSGRVVFDQDGRPVRRIGTFQDITEQKRTEARLWEAANRDALTGLPNRSRFGVDLESALSAAKQTDGRVALFVVDLDNFKEINDTLGHDAGDHVLRGMAERLVTLRTAGCTIARLGGDEFAMLLPLTREVAAVHDQAAAMIGALNQPMALAGGALNCFASVGVAIYPDHAPDGAELLKTADLALYEAKRGGRAKYALFDLSLKAVLLRRVGVLQRARDALARHDIVPFYQPKACIGGAGIPGFEALLRLREGATIVAPAAIAEAFDDPELSVRIGQRMLESVIADIRQWRAEGVPFGSIAVNVSAAEFTRFDLAEAWLGHLRHAGLPTSVLQMEVTESVFLDGSSDTVGTALATLHRAGLDIALDDFGTGFASLTHLRKFPVSWLKIDQTFVRDLGTDSSADAIVSAVITLAHAIGIRVVAEGVETPLQAAILAAKGCDTAQGYLISKPMPASRVPDFVRSWDGLHPDRLDGRERA